MLLDYTANETSSYIVDSMSYSGNSTADTCARIQVNETIIASGPIIAMVVGFFGLIAIIGGIVLGIYSRKKEKDKEKQIKL